MLSKIKVPAASDRARARFAAVSVFTAVTLLSGCAGLPGKSVTVGAVPDDYRTNHPIIVSEQERTVDIPVATGDRALTISMRETVRGAARDYHSSASGAIRIMVPSGSANSGAASLMAGQVSKLLQSEGIPRDRILTSPYQVVSPNDAAPLRIAFLAITASTDKCGRWPDDLAGDTSENRHWANFGCSYQSNLAAQIANPGDLIAPRGMSAIDAGRRAKAIENYREKGNTF